jgi:hypothetical protein
MRRRPKYQLVILGAEAARCRPRFVRALKRRLNEIGTDLGTALRVFRPSKVDRLDPIAPAVAVYFGSDEIADAAAVQVLLTRAVPVLPVVYDLNSYTHRVPPTLHLINGIAVGERAPNFAAVVNLVLENLSLLRRVRRLFLSYRRHESTPVAQQLRVAFDGLGYDAFLDTNSVPKGDDFQSVLWHRLLDSDVMVVLDTADFLGSRYTQLEIAQASAMAVGILQVLWPGVTRAPHTTLAVPLQLSDSDFDGDHLTDAAVARITIETEALRARSLAARHTNLVVEYCAEATRVGATVSVQPERFVLTELGDGRRIAAIPAVGVPDALRYHEACGHFAVDGMQADEALLIYDHRGMLPQWMAFLDWLDDFLPVKGLRVTDTAARLGTT